MKIKSPLGSNPSIHILLRLVLVFCILLLTLLIPNGGTLADSNAPTQTYTPLPTETPVPDNATPEPALTDTAVPPIPPTDDSVGALLIPTQIPPVTRPPNQLSTINIILMVCLGAAVVLVIAVLVYIFRQQSLGGSRE